MSLKVTQPAVSTLATTAAVGPEAGATHSILPGGCVHPRFPRDGFDPKLPPIDRCPPPDFGGGVDPLYRFKLRNMSDQQLQMEMIQQQINLLVSQFLGDKQGVADARAKLQAIQQEQLRRAFGGGHDLELALYKQHLKGMTNSQLQAEERKQFSNYIMAMLRGDSQGAQRAKEKLEAVHHEQLSRMSRPFPLFPSKPAEPIYRAL